MVTASPPLLTGARSTASWIVSRSVSRPFCDQELLCPLEHLRQRAPQLLRLVNERRHDQKPDSDERADDEQVENQDRQPSRKAARADREESLALDQPDDRAEADRQQPAHVDQEQDVANEDTQPRGATTVSAAIQIVQRLMAFWSETADTRYAPRPDRKWR